MSLRKILYAIAFGALAVLMIWMNNDMQPHLLYDVSTFYIQDAYGFTTAPNSVTAIYLFYRYYDTLFEAMMLIFSVVGVIYLSVHEED